MIYKASLSNLRYWENSFKHYKNDYAFYKNDLKPLLENGCDSEKIKSVILKKLIEKLLNINRRKIRYDYENVLQARCNKLILAIDTTYSKDDIVKTISNLDILHTVTIVNGAILDILDIYETVDFQRRVSERGNQWYI